MYLLFIKKHKSTANNELTVTACQLLATFLVCTDRSFFATVYLSNNVNSFTNQKHLSYLLLTSQ